MNCSSGWDGTSVVSSCNAKNYSPLLMSTKTWKISWDTKLFTSRRTLCLSLCILNINLFYKTCSLSISKALDVMSDSSIHLAPLYRSNSCTWSLSCSSHHLVTLLVQKLQWSVRSSFTHFNGEILLCSSWDVEEIVTYDQLDTLSWAIQHEFCSNWCRRFVDSGWRTQSKWKKGQKNKANLFVVSCLLTSASCAALSLSLSLSFSGWIQFFAIFHLSSRNNCAFYEEPLFHFSCPSFLFFSLLFFSSFFHFLPRLLSLVLFFICNLFSLVRTWAQSITVNVHMCLREGRKEIHVKVTIFTKYSQNEIALCFSVWLGRNFLSFSLFLSLSLTFIRAKKYLCRCLFCCFALFLSRLHWTSLAHLNWVQEERKYQTERATEREIREKKPTQCIDKWMADTAECYTTQLTAVTVIRWLGCLLYHFVRDESWTHRGCLLFFFHLLTIQLASSHLDVYMWHSKLNVDWMNAPVKKSHRRP